MDVLLTQLYGMIMILNLFGIVVASCMVYNMEFKGSAIKKMYMLMNGCTIKTAAADDARAIPLKKPATPTPRGTHIFSKREEISTIKVIGGHVCAGRNAPVSGAWAVDGKKSAL